MPQVTRKFEWDSGHRILNHESKCRNPHGHRYVAEVTVWSEGLDNLGRVVDFGELKRIIGEWIDRNWDHTMILSKDDSLANVDEVKNAERKPYIIGSTETFSDTGGLSSFSPTAEVLVLILHNVCERLLPDYLEVRKIRLYETPNCSAEWPE